MPRCVICGDPALRTVPTVPRPGSVVEFRGETFLGPIRNDACDLPVCADHALPTADDPHTRALRREVAANA